ncbi:MAG: DMT family protein [Devosia sp.]
MPAFLLSPAVLPVLLLIGSNVFMTTAWYGHLKYPNAALWVAVMASWGIALVEYWLAVPANRIGYIGGTYSAAELKTIQEVISLTVFAGFAVFVLKEPLTWNHAVGFGLIGAGAFFIFKGPL